MINDIKNLDLIPVPSVRDAFKELQSMAAEYVSVLSTLGIEFHYESPKVYLREDTSVGSYKNDGNTPCSGTEYQMYIAYSLNPMKAPEYYELYNGHARHCLYWSSDITIRDYDQRIHSRYCSCNVLTHNDDFRKACHRIENTTNGHTVSLSPTNLADAYTLLKAEMEYLKLIETIKGIIHSKNNG